MRTTEQKIAEAEAKLNRLKNKQRAETTREKIIIGALVQSAIVDDREKREWVLGLLRGVTREADKATAEKVIKQIMDVRRT